MQDEGDDDKDREPGEVAERYETRSGEEFADDVDVAQILRFERRGFAQRAAMHGAEHRRGHFLVEQHARPHEQARPQHLEAGPNEEKKRCDNRDAGEGDEVAGAKHAIVDLQHVQAG